MLCSEIEKERKNIEENVQTILKHDIFPETQTTLAKELGVSQSMISKTLNKTSYLSILLYFQKKYHLSLEILKEKALTPEEISRLFKSSGTGDSPLPSEKQREAEKYLGCYFAYYFHSGNQLNRDRDAESLLSFGLIDVDRGIDSAEDELDVWAIMGCHDMDVHRIFNFINHLYLNPEFDDEQRALMIKLYLKQQIEQEMRSHQARFYHVGDDSEWYKMIKPYQKEKKHDNHRK